MRSILPSFSYRRSSIRILLLLYSQCEQPLADGQDANMGIGLTAHIVLALGRRGLGAIRMLQCNHLISEQISYQHGKSFIIYLFSFKKWFYSIH